MLKGLIAAALLLSATAAEAQTRHNYDYRTGNAYNTHRDQNGATIRGYNSQTGSTWSQRQNNNGSYSGVDSNGNYYSGNNRTGTYINSGTGKICTGTGYSRVCN
jgi:hypothetical protein